MTKSKIIYWILTALFCLAMGAAGVLNLIRFEGQQESMTGLGYPVYLMSILGVAKVLGVIALLIPRTPLLKEWAYAGFTFDLLGASASHAFAGHSPPEIIVPLVFLAVLFGSYWLRPSTRRLSLAGEVMSTPIKAEETK
ncbi:MAG: DoxX family protein [Planctomycetota bacterium]